MVKVILVGYKKRNDGAFKRGGGVDGELFFKTESLTLRTHMCCGVLL